VRTAGENGKEQEGLTLIGYAGAPDGSEWVRESVSGDPAQPVALAEALIELLDAAGARGILRRAAGEGDGRGEAPLL
jgi:hypothetical protein